MFANLSQVTPTTPPPFIFTQTTLHNQKHKHSVTVVTPTFLPSPSKSIPSMHHTRANFPIFAYRYAKSSYTNE